MLSPRLTNCPECADIPSLIKKIDCKLAELGNNLYNNISYMLNKSIPSTEILQLIGYRRILAYKYCNPNYAHKYSVQMIASRVIRLTAGCVSKCNEPEPCLEDPCDIDIVPNPTTTSTSTIAPSTTTTSSSTTTTTTTIAQISPDDINGLWAWYKGDVGIIGTSQVINWQDQSGLTNDLLTNSTYYPEAVSDTVGTLNTTVIKKINYATLANMSTAADFPNTNATGVTLFVVGKVISSPGLLNYVVKAPTTELYTNNTPSMNSLVGGGSTLNQSISLNTYYTFRNNTDLSNVYFSINNNTPLTDVFSPSFYLARPFRIFSQGGPYPFPSEQGDMAYAEIIVYNTVLTPSEIAGVEAYLRNKYNHY